METVFTVLGLVSVGFIAGYICCAILSVNSNAPTFYEGVLLNMHKQLEEAGETIFVLSNEKANLQDTITILEGK